MLHGQLACNTNRTIGGNRTSLSFKSTNENQLSCPNLFCNPYIVSGAFKLTRHHLHLIKSSNYLVPCYLILFFNISNNSGRFKFLQKKNPTKKKTTQQIISLLQLFTQWPKIPFCQQTLWYTLVTSPIFFYGKTSDATFRLEKFWQYCQIFGIHFSPCPRNQSPVGPKTRMHKVKLLVQSYLGTRQLQLVKSSTCRVLMRKDVSALGACSGLIALARACMSHNTAPQGEMLHHLSLARYLLISAHVVNSGMN